MIRWRKPRMTSYLCSQQIARAILTGTHGRVRQLRVEQQSGRICIEGEVPNFYLGQLALAAVQGQVRQAGAVLDWQVRVR